MDAISPVTGSAYLTAPLRPDPVIGGNTQRANIGLIEPGPATKPSLGSMCAGSTVAGSQFVAGASSLAINQSSQMLIATEGLGPAITSNELLGAVLLMLILEYMRSSDEADKKGLLALALAVAQLQQQGGSQQNALYYASSSLSVESSQFQVASTDFASGAYTNAGINPGPPIDPGLGGLDVVA